MLSAVENHFGPSRLYATGAHPYNTSSAAAIGANSNLIAAPCPIVALPTPMSATEFARPHPKPNPNRYNGSQSLRNGLSSPSSRSKYSPLDQSAPVNLAVSQSMENGALVLSHKPSEVAALCAAAKPSSLESEQDAISSSIASLYQHKMPYCPPSIPDAASPLYYPNFYARPSTGSVYGHSIYAAPSSHAMGGARNPLHHGVATYPHVDSYSNPHLFGPNAYSPPAAARPNLSPHSPIGTITVGSASQNTNNTSISTQSVLPANASPLSVSPPSMFTQQQQHQQQHQHQHQHQQHQQQHQHQQHQHQQQQYHLKSSSEHNSISVAKPISTYRTEPKEKESRTLNGKAADFKIPSGKEGSLKHRILTRPYGEKEPTTKQAQKQALPTHSQNNVVTKSSVKTKNNNVNSNNNNNNNNACSKNKNIGSSSTPTNFSKGTLIELSSGELKRVEDMRTEDFITSSSKNPNLQLIDTTVIEMTPQSKNNVLITLSYKNNKICMETRSSHPFFVYGKGWASFSPDTTLQEHGLKCQSLEVGDVCISLTPREPQPKSSDSVVAAPQNLSRKQMPHTISTTSTGTAVTSRPVASYEQYSQHMMQQRHPNDQPMYGGQHHGRPSGSNYSTMAPPPPPPNTDSSSNSYDEAIDATMHSRGKRRAWSVSEHCDDQKKVKSN